MKETEEDLQGCPVVFLAYTWDSDVHRSWVRALGARLRSAGVDLLFDGWELQPGDQLGHYMERGIRESDFVLCICTPRYKKRFDDRLGGAGYEANLISGEARITGNERKFIGLLREGEPIEALPSWLLDKSYLDFRGDPYSEESRPNTFPSSKTPPSASASSCSRNAR